MDRIHRFARALAIACIAVLLPTGALASAYAGAQAESESGEAVRFVFTVKVGAESRYATSETYERKAWNKAWAKARQDASSPAPPPYSDTYVEVVRPHAAQTFTLAEDGVLVDPRTGGTVVLPDAIRREMLECAEALRSKHYGELIPWEEASRRLPRKAKLTVVDLETGLSFRGQRRAGSHHADVQPLTKQDSAIMKEIYGGAWSWKRRAVLVLADGRPIAASMHGMPHGGDGIPDNGFSGHFCIHFMGSSTHKSGHVDGAHQLMVRKAAGRLASFVRESSPERKAEAFLESIRQQDETLLRVALERAPSETFDKYRPLIGSVEGLRYEALREKPYEGGELTADLVVKTVVHRKGGGNRTVTFRFAFARESLQSPWAIVRVDDSTGTKGR
ncbi:hypothetical protein [Paenibacillus flagellatus]|uniref:Uncharacterized protein n=1 Tax=Paenibacillus flagellatus TaxID=2211139 RepID=A0A2V5JY97_9BACL|nr:hypothetical protein [Paenibacillus flagellatus]PYI51855.1 hypothetical protein DLM86_23345 [Paenibacillus flagellatus]